MLDKPSNENQAGRSHQESAKKKQFCAWEQEAETTVSRQTAPEHTYLLPTRYVRALGKGHNWHQGPYHSPFPHWWRHTGWYGKAVPHPGCDCWEISTGSMDSCIHRWVSNERGDQRRGRYCLFVCWFFVCLFVCLQISARAYMVSDDVG